MKVRFWLKIFLCAAAAFIFLQHPLSPVLTAQNISPLTPQSKATVVATQSGNWSNPGTWDVGPPPRSARIVIPEGITVTVDGDLPEPYEWIRVEGSLRFAPNTNTSLTLETLAVEHSGTLEIGTVDQPVTARAVLTFQHSGGTIDHLYDPMELSRGLVAMGRVEMHGQPKTSWVSVSEIPAAGELWVTLDRLPVGWAPGDAVVLTSSRYGENETFEILSVDGAEVRLDHPIANTRPFPVNPKTSQAYEGLTLHVGNLSRNVVVRTHPDYAGQPKLQGHVMLMHRGGHSIKYVAFEDLGRTTIDPVTDPVLGDGGVRDPSLCPPFIAAENVRGRYALHFHMATPFSEQSVVEGSALTVRRGSRLKIGYINHSSNVLFKNNVGLNIDGSTFFTEEGDEVGGFVDNLAIHSVGSNGNSDEQPGGVAVKNSCPALFQRRRADVGHRGYGFWVHSGGMAVNGNVAAEHGSTGFSIWTLGLNFRITNTFEVLFPTSLLPNGGAWVQPAASAVKIGAVPFVFRNNTSYVQSHASNSRRAAFEVTYHALHQAETYPASPKNIFADSLGWNARTGIATSYTGWVAYEHVRLIKGDLMGVGADRGGQQIVGMNLSSQGGNHNTLTDIVIEGFTVGIRPSSATTFENVMVDGARYLPSTDVAAPAPERRR
jgi:G8 domain